MFASLSLHECLRVAAIAILLCSARCHANNQCSTDTSGDNTESSISYPDSLSWDSDSFVQIAVQTRATLRNKHGTTSSFRQPDILAIETSRFAYQRLVPAVCILASLIVLGLLLRLYRSLVCNQDITSDRAEEVGATSTIALLGNVWPNIILAAVVVGMMIPLEPYICLNFFARSYTHLHPEQIHCEETPEAEYCKHAAKDNVWWTSFMSVVSAVVHIGLGPALGVLSDAFGRKPILMACTALKFIPSMAFALVVFSEVNLYLWYVLSIFSYLPSVAVWFALITDLIVEPERRATAFGFCMLGWELSMLAGMVVGACLSVQATVAVSIILTIANLLYVFMILRETLPERLRAPLQVKTMTPVAGLSILFRTSLISRLCFVLIVSEFVKAGLDKIGFSYFQKHLGFDKTDNYVKDIFAQVSVLGWIACLMHQIIVLIGEVGVLLVAQGFGVLLNVGIYLSASASQVFALQGALSGAVGLIFPATAALKGSMVAESEQGHLQGAVQGIRSLATCLGPVFFGFIFNWSEENAGTFGCSPAGQCASFIFILGALFHGCTLPVIISMPRDSLQKQLTCDS